MFGKKFKQIIQNLELRISRLEGAAAEESLYESIYHLQTGAQPLDELEAKFVSEYLPKIKMMMEEKVRKEKSSARSITISKIDYTDSGLIFLLESYLISNNYNRKRVEEIYEPQYKSFMNDLYDIMVQIGWERLENLLNSKTNDKFQVTLKYHDSDLNRTRIGAYDVMDVRSAEDLDRHKCKNKYDIQHLSITWM